MTGIKTRKISKTLGLSFLSAAFILYFLPDFIIIDPLPDVIGYILTVIGLTQLSDISEEIAGARKKFAQMIIVGAVRLFAVFVAFGWFDTGERPTALLTVAFVLGIAECLILIPAYLRMFDGFLYLGTRHNGTAVFSDGKKKYRKSYTDSVKRFTVLFIIIKNAMSVLPEFLALSVDRDFQSYNYQRYDDVNNFRIIAMIVAGIFGIIWLCRIEKYINRLKKDKPFIECLTEKYRTEILPRESVFFLRRVMLAFLMFGLGAFCAVDFYIDGNDGFNILPDIVSAMLFFAGTLIISEKKSVYRLPALITAAVYGLISLVTWKLNYDFTYEYTAKEVSRDVTANALWKILTAVSVVEAAGFIAMTVCACLVLSETVKKSTGFLPDHPTTDPVAKARELHRSLNRLLYISGGIAALSGAAGVLRVWMFSSESIVADASWIIEAGLTAVFAIVFSFSLYRIKDEVQEKYLLT